MTDNPPYLLPQSDISPENIEALRRRCAASPHSRRVEFQVGDCNDLVDRVVAQIRPIDRVSLNLAFLDPEGMELHWTTIVKLAGVRRMDLIINYPQGGLNRTMPAASEKDPWTSVDHFFGDPAWREIHRKWRGRRELHWHLIDFYIGRLQDLGYRVRRDDEVGDEPLIRNARRRAPLYRLLFASKHPLGQDFWHKITRRNVYGQASLW